LDTQNNLFHGTLQKIAGMGDYSTSQMFITSLPALSNSEANDGETAAVPFRAGSRPKFNSY
jgi:hypothetical protein